MFRQEPAVIITTVTAFIVQLFALLALFGLDLPQEIKTTILAVVEPIVLLIFLTGVAVRANVYSPATVEDRSINVSGGPVA